MNSAIATERGQRLATNVVWARSPLERMRGLIGSPLAPGDALVLVGARQVHTFGVRHAIDVVFCDRSWKIVHIARSMRPNRVTRWVRNAVFAIEMRAGEVPDTLRPGETLVVEREG